MKFQVGGQGWPIGATLIPAGTILDLGRTGRKTDWEKLAAGRAPPLDASVLDDEAAAAMAKHYTNVWTGRVRQFKDARPK